MRHTMSLSVSLAISLLAASCAGNAPASRPVVVVEAPTDEEIADGVTPHEYHGIPGLFFTWEAWRNVVIKMKIDKKDLEISLAGETTRADIAEQDAAQLRKAQKATEWRAQWLPPLAFGGGVLVAGTLAAVLFAVLLGGVK